MKTRILLIALLTFSSFQLFAQHDLIGTWERINDTIKSVKIVTPTHWMVYAESLNQNGTEFLWSHGGTYTLNGDNYVENIETASWEDYDDVKTNFTVKIDGNTWYHKGKLTSGDGTVWHTDEVWKKVSTNTSYDNNPSIGVWDQLKSSYTQPDGTKDSHTNATATRFQIITPTHWMRISHREGEFESFMGGTYKLEGDKMYPDLEYSSYPETIYNEVVIEQKVNGDKLYWNGYARSIKDNQTLTFEDEFQQVNPKVAKAKTKR